VAVRASATSALGAAEVFEDSRGRLTLVPWERLSFTPARVYVLSEIPAGVSRGAHAARSQHRFLVWLSGSAMVVLDDGRETKELRLASPETLHIPPGTWHEIIALDDDLSVLVLADGPYDPGDYITDRSMLPIASASAEHTAPA
jgi:dTDP-4-dehydrorhamnose 3,5-epimerase-like enzyme